MEWDPSDIVAATSAGLLLVTIAVSLFIGIKSIRITNKIEEKKYRMGLLNDLSSWGIDVLATCHTTNLSKEAIEQSKQQAYNPGATRDIIARQSIALNKAEYFKHSDINNLISRITSLIALISNCLVKLYDGETMITELVPNDLVKMKNLGIKYQDNKVPIIDVCRDVLVMTQRDTSKYLEKVNDLIREELT